MLVSAYILLRHPLQQLTFVKRGGASESWVVWFTDPENRHRNLLDRVTAVELLRVRGILSECSVASAFRASAFLAPLRSRWGLAAAHAQDEVRIRPAPVAAVTFQVTLACCEENLFYVYCAQIEKMDCFRVPSTYARRFSLCRLNSLTITILL